MIHVLIIAVCYRLPDLAVTRLPRCSVANIALIALKSARKIVLLSAGETGNAICRIYRMENELRYISITALSAKILQMVRKLRANC
jgi:hypothetical protein